MSISEELCYTTVRIKGYPANGEFTGSGFFFHFLNDENGYEPCVVTNRHVLLHAQTVSLRFTCLRADGIEYFENFNITDFQKAWIGHPNQNVDLGVIPISLLLRYLRLQGKEPHYIPLTKEYIPSIKQISELHAIEDIIMLGYPNGMWDEINNKPIARKGITATHVKYDFNGKKEFLIDAACFPGSSGSPVFILNEGVYSNGDSGINLGKRLYFLGILYAGPQHSADGKVVFSSIPSIITRTNIPNNLGLVIRSEELFVFEEELKKKLFKQSVK